MQYKTFSLRTHKKNWRIKRPNVCQFELTFKCDLRCRHCYSDCYNEEEYIKRELTSSHMKLLIDKVYNSGVIWLCFTGGNILIQKKLPLDLDPYYKGSNASSLPIIHNFLINQRIKRIELDNLGQGILLRLPKGRISASVYTPYVYITTTFFCPTAGCDQKKKSILKIKPCKRQCQRYVFKLRHKTMPKLIYLKGNTPFYKNTRLSMRELEESGVDRIVYQPEIPI